MEFSYKNNMKRVAAFPSLTLLVALIAVSPVAADDQSSTSAIKSRAEFDALAVVYDANTPYALPHVLFVIDRQHNNRIYYVNTRLYKFHKDFANGTYLSL